ncbi:hypothetical protein IH992_24765 [Candidatus Poribacteria bacterium]|nr:hypothetical protein [Candidatus Poribacteria bacterium]
MRKKILWGEQVPALHYSYFTIGEIEMTRTDELLSIIKDRTIGIDAWSDYYLDEAIDLAEKLCKSGDLEKCLQETSLLDEEAKIRLFEVILDISSPEMVPKLLQILTEADGELVEVLIDGLRSWPLEIDQRKQLLFTAGKVRGQSTLLGSVDEFGETQW